MNAKQLIKELSTLPPNTIITIPESVLGTNVEVMEIIMAIGTDTEEGIVEDEDGEVTFAILA